VIQFKVQMVTADFRNTWYHDSKRFLYVNSLMSPEEQEIFFMDLTKVNMITMSRQLTYGIQKYYLGQDVPNVDYGFRQIVRKNQFPIGYH
jgi:hypothetical protein